MVMSVMSFNQGQIVCAPTTDSMCQSAYLRIASCLELSGRSAGMLAVGAGQNDGFFLVLVQFDHAGGETVQRNVDRIDNMPGGELLLRTHIHHQRVLAVDQCRRLLGSQRLAGLAALGEYQQRKYNQKGAGQPIMIAYEFDKLL